MQTLEEKLTEYVNDPSFFSQLKAWLDQVASEKPEKAFSMALDLAGFVTPRVKTKEPQNGDKPLQIAIQFIEEHDASKVDATSDEISEE